MSFNFDFQIKNCFLFFDLFADKKSTKTLANYFIQSDNRIIYSAFSIELFTRKILHKSPTKIFNNFNEVLPSESFLLDSIKRAFGVNNTNRPEAVCIID